MAAAPDAGQGTASDAMEVEKGDVSTASVTTDNNSKC